MISSPYVRLKNIQMVAEALQYKYNNLQSGRKIRKDRQYRRRSLLPRPPQIPPDPSTAWIQKSWSQWSLSISVLLLHAGSSHQAQSQEKYSSCVI